MGRQSKLTNIQKEMLKKSGHVAKMTDIYVHFNSSFINKFCIEYHAGKPAEIILAENGIDPVILGKGRVSSLRRYYTHEWLPRHEGVAERKTVATNSAYNTKLEHEIQYLQQEIDALKKILQIDPRMEESEN